MMDFQINKEFQNLLHLKKYQNWLKKKLCLY